MIVKVLQAIGHFFRVVFSSSFWYQFVWMERIGKHRQVHEPTRHLIPRVQIDNRQNEDMRRRVRALERRYVDLVQIGPAKRDDGERS